MYIRPVFIWLEPLCWCFVGKYVYIESSAPRKPGDKARLISPQITSTSPMCMSFYYHMYGQHIGTLNVYLKTGNTLPRSAVWSKSLNQGNKWILGQTTIQATQPYNVGSFKMKICNENRNFTNKHVIWESFWKVWLIQTIHIQ